MIRAALLVSAVLMGGTCQTPGPKPPVPTPDAGPVVADAGDECGVAIYDACGFAGATLCALQCRDKSGAPLWRTPGGRPFAEVCREAMVDGRNWRPDCLTRIADCSEVETAFRTKVGAPCAR